MTLHNGLDSYVSQAMKNTLPIALIALSTACGGLEPELETEFETTQDAISSNMYAWVWTNTPAGSIGGTYSSVGGTNSVTHQGTGQYSVRLNGIFVSGGHVQVVAEGPNSSQCKVAGWTSFPVTISVRCYGEHGVPVNSDFVAVFADPSSSSTGRWAYAWANQPTNTFYTPHTTYQGHYSGGSNAVWRMSTGRYRVYMSGISAGSANAQVTAYGANSNFCNISTMQNSYVEVECYRATDGSLVDTQFTIAYLSHGALLIPNDRRGYSLHANRPYAYSYYTPAREYLRPSSNHFAIGRWAPGHDHVTLSPQTVPTNLNRSAALVSSYGAGGPRYCKPVNAGYSFNDLDVWCYGRSGGGNSVLIASEYLLQGISRDPIF